jgi:hypothetical protein
MSNGLPAYRYGYVPPVEHPSGTTVLVLGILALVICPFTGIFAITTGNRALREIDAQPTAYTNRQQVVVGRILGIVGLAVYGTLIVGYVIFAVVVIGMIGLGSR